MDRESLLHRLRLTPGKPGVYILKDAAGKPIYVGKAANLQNRLRNYFGSSQGLGPKISRMVTRIGDFDYIVTDTEGEALILECTFIKKHKPYYNARLKDDKSYPFIKIDLTEDFPQVYVTRRLTSDGARYFGPFATAHSVRKTLDLLKKLFPYRSCTKVITGTDPRPCLEYYINRCVAPCIGAVDKQEYNKVVQQVVMFMEGKSDAIVDDLKSKMEQASETLEFERAARLRDQIKAIRQTIDELQIKVSSSADYDLDAIALAQGADETWVEVFMVRNGKLIGRDHFIMEGTEEDSPSHILSQFLKQFYQSASYIAPTVLVQHPVEEEELIRAWLREKRGGKVVLTHPVRGDKRKLVKMVAENAAQGLTQRRAKWLSNTGLVNNALNELQEELNLPGIPRRMECYDISNIQGSNPVASMVTFVDGRPRPAEYRRFRIKAVDGINDYAMMQEVLRRRFKRLAENVGKRNSTGPDQPDGQDKDTWGAVPDLVLIDGGKGHLSAALEVFLELGVDFIPLASIAKENEWLYVPHTPEPIILPRDSQGLYLVQRMRDEAHRFAITYHRRLRSKSSVSSSMDLVKGIGPKRKRMLLRKFGSVKGIKEASLEEITQVPGMTRELAARLKLAL